MNVEKLGEGDPEHAVVGLIHGDEPCGRKAIEKFKKSEYKLEKPVKLIVANEKAAEKNVRYIDCDLNRNFPGDPESSQHEERLAADILEEVQGLKTLSIHSTKSYPKPFAAQSVMDTETLELIKETGVEKACFIEDGVDCLGEYSRTVTVESGLQGSDRSAENAYEVMLNFLAANNVIKSDYELSNPEIFEVFDTVEKPGYRFTGENFRKINPGEVYAEKEGKNLEAEEGFYPVLMSTDGYETILGHKARKVDEEEI
jgi:succinylglutamate desuccinylase